MQLIRLLFVAALLLCMVSSVGFCAETIKLWPNGAPGAKGTEKNDSPTLTLYPVAGKKNAHFTYTGGQHLYIDRRQGGGKEADKPVQLASENITVTKCLFAGAQNSALRMKGSELTVENCVFMENNRHANFESKSLVLSASGAYKVTRNTFFNSCSEGVD